MGKAHHVPFSQNKPSQVGKYVPLKSVCSKIPCGRLTKVSVPSLAVLGDVWTNSHQLRDKTVRL